jgi:ADP-ribosyl-[dinitrogen reductase] hydrolase
MPDSLPRLPDINLVGLRIDAVPAGPRGGLIGMCHCPGRHPGDLLAGTRRDDLISHLRDIASWRARALVSLLEPDELHWCGIADLPERAGRLGLRHLHLPIRDMGVPGPEFERRWETEGALLREMLLEGERIVLHCLAGLGRTGTVAARLLVELGTEPGEAIRAVRLARPGTIQTPEQEQYVLRCAGRVR